MLSLLTFSSWSQSHALMMPIILSFVFAISCFLFFRYAFHFYDSEHLGIAGIMLLLAFGDIALYVYNNVCIKHIANDINTVRVYHRMNHMKRIYPKLPCHVKPVSKHCSKSLSSDVNNLQRHNHTLTKVELRNRYYHDKQNYGNPHYIKVPAIHWWNYL